MKIRICETPEDTAAALARRVAEALAKRPALVLSLPAGRTPVAAYAALQELHKAGKVDFSGATTFNLDEFAGIPSSHPGSFHTFMQRHLFAGLGLRPQQIHSLNGAAPDLEAECDRYEAAIDEAGGIDLQVLGIGVNGHVGFNEPGEELVAPTHRVTLTESTRRASAPLFGGDWAQVPREGLSMGMGTILKASAVLLIATGERKAQCVERTVHGPLSTRLPASFLQVHRDVELYLDRAATAGLRRT
jgi:glucosamine-6-phosphate deaminase